MASFSADSVKLFKGVGGASSLNPTDEIEVPADYKILGGGARLEPENAEVGQLMVSSYPETAHKWVVEGKAHDTAVNGVIYAYAIAIYDPADEWDVRIFSNSTSGTAPQEISKEVVSVPNGYLMTGGGALVNYSGPGSLLTASYPPSDNEWEARSKSHTHPSPSRIRVFAIGIRSKKGVELEGDVSRRVGDVEQHPESKVQVRDGFVLTGGGALITWSGAGNLLTDSYPLDLGWTCKGKDHDTASPASITAYSVGIRQR